MMGSDIFQVDGIIGHGDNNIDCSWKEEMKILEFIKRGRDNADQNLIEQENKKTGQIFKNRLFLTSLLNSVIFLVFVFSMAYYNWGKITIPLKHTNEQAIDPQSPVSVVTYFNLLYVRTVDNAAYSSFGGLATDICLNNDLFCWQALSSLQFLGYLCFSILLVGALFQIYDIAYMLYFLYKKEDNSGRYVQSKQDNLRHVGTIGLFLVGLTLQVFGMSFISIPYSYGASFWVFVMGLFCFVALIVYQQFSVGKLEQQKMMLKLIQGEKNITAKMEMDIEMSAEGEHYI